MKKLPGRDASGPKEQPGNDAAGWTAVERQLEADAQFRKAFAATGADLRRPTLDLLAYLHAVRARLQALRDTAHAAGRLAARAAANDGKDEGGKPR
ncbi:MAG: hypothetical protein EOO24_16110 [Comamonadaceae bacterium]|nr:MAG: hypothetical protein EOO24_16110 [Comamonadaceae bacterium]